MAPPFLSGDPCHPPILLAGAQADRELLAAAKQLPRLGSTPLPPRTTTPVVGELLLFCPSLLIKSQAAPRPSPTRLQVRAAWWGEEEAGTVLLPRVLEGATKIRVAGGRPLEPRTSENTCVFPVRVEEGALWSYLGDMGHLRFRVEDANTGRLYATASLRLAEQRAVPRQQLQRLALHYSLGEEADKRQGPRRRRRQSALQGPVIGEAFVQLQVRMGPHSALRRLLSALGRPQPGAPGAMSAAVVDALLRRVMDPDNVVAMKDLMGYPVEKGFSSIGRGWSLREGGSEQGEGGGYGDQQQLRQGRRAWEEEPEPEEEDEEDDELVRLAEERRLLGAFEAEGQDQQEEGEWREEEQEVAEVSDEDGRPFPELALAEEEGVEGEGAGGGSDCNDDDLRASLLAYVQDEARALADEGSDRLPLWPPEGVGGSPAPATATAGVRTIPPSPAPSARHGPPPGPTALLPPILSSVDQFAATVPLPPAQQAGAPQPVPTEGEDGRYLQRIREALRGRRRRHVSLSSSEGKEEEEEEEEAGMLASLRGLLAGLRDEQGEPLMSPAAAPLLEDAPAEYNRVAGPALWAMLEGLLGHEAEEMAAGAESDEEDDLIRCLLAGGSEGGSTTHAARAQEQQQQQTQPQQGDRKGGAAAVASSTYPALAAAERRRRERLSAARFLRVGFSTLTLLQGDRPPKRLLLRYTPPPPALLPPSLGTPGRPGRVEAAMVRGPGGDSAFSKLHPGSYAPERLPPHRQAATTNPLALLLELDDAALARWLAEPNEGGGQEKVGAALAVEVLAPLGSLDRRTRDALLRAHPKPHPPEQPLLVARASLPLRQLLAAPGLALGTTLELRPTAAAAAVWKTGKGRGGRALMGTLAMECALLDAPSASASAATKAPPSRAPALPRFASSSSASSAVDEDGREQATRGSGGNEEDKGGSAFPSSPRRLDFSASSPLPRFEAIGGGASGGDTSASRVFARSSTGFENGEEAAGGGAEITTDASAATSAEALRLLLSAGRVWGPALRGLRDGEAIRLRYKGPSAQGHEASAGPADTRGQNASACASLRDFGHEALLPCGAALGDWLNDANAGHAPLPLLPPMVLELWATPTSGEAAEEGRKEKEGRLLGLVKLPIDPAAQALAQAARPTARLLPFVGAEGPQPVVSPFDGRAVAHVEACLALGTEEQLERLRRARGPLRRLQARVRGALSRSRRRPQGEQGEGREEEDEVSHPPPPATFSSGDEAAPPPQRTRPLRLRALLERAEAASMAASASATASMSLHEITRRRSVAGEEMAEEDDVSIGELLRRRRRAAALGSTAASSSSVRSASHAHRGGSRSMGREEEEEGPFGLSDADGSGSRWTLLGGASSSGVGVVAPHEASTSARSSTGRHLAVAGGARDEGGGARVKHVLDVSVAGECRLEWAGGGASPPSSTLACYVRYVVRRSPLHALLGEAASQDEGAILTAAGGLGGMAAADDSLLASAAGLVSDPAGWQAVCLWWDLEDCDLNSRARHVLYTAVSEAGEEGEEEREGEAAAAALCGGEGMRLQVWVTGLEGGHGPARLVGTARASQASLARLMRRETGMRTLRLEVVGPEETSITSPPPPVRVRTLDLALSYYREPQLVTRLRRSRLALAGTGMGSSSAPGAAAVRVAMGPPEEEDMGPVGQGNGRTLLTGLGGESRSRLLYGESTVVDRVLPRTGRLCVELLDLVGPWPPRAQRSSASAPSSFVLEYEIETGHAAGEGQQRRRRFAHRLPSSRTAEGAAGGAVHFVDVVEVALNDAFMEFLFAGPLELRLSTVSSEQAQEGDRAVVVATLHVPLREVLTRLTGVSGVFPWRWVAPLHGGQGEREGGGGGARVAVYFQHQKPFLPGRSDDDDDDDGHDHSSGGGGGGGSGGRGSWGSGVEESKRGGIGSGDREGRGLFSLTRFGSTTDGGGGNERLRGLTERAILEDEEEGMLVSSASLLGASSGSLVSSWAIAAAVEGLVTSGKTGASSLAVGAAARVAPLDHQGLAAVQGLVSDLSTLDKSLLSSFGGDGPRQGEQQGSILSLSRREQGLQTDGRVVEGQDEEDEEEGEEEDGTTAATATNVTASSGSGSMELPTNPKKTLASPAVSTTRDVLATKGNATAVPTTSNNSSSGSSKGSKVVARLTRRFGDEETERIAHIMMGTLSRSFSGGASASN